MTESGSMILIVDDERPIRRFLRASLGAHGYAVIEAENGTEAITSLTAHHPDLVILDLTLPDMDGLEVLKHLREWNTIPVIILSVRDNEQEKIRALDAGADDYLTKPFGVGELSARIRAALRHSQKIDAAVSSIHVNELQVDFVHRRITLAGEEISLTPTEYALLKFLLANAGKVVTHHMLLREVWGIGYENDPHMVRVNISTCGTRSSATRPSRNIS